MIPLQLRQLEIDLGDLHTSGGQLYKYEYNLYFQRSQLYMVSFEYYRFEIEFANELSNLQNYVSAVELTRNSILFKISGVSYGDDALRVEIIDELTSKMFSTVPRRIFEQNIQVSGYAQSIINLLGQRECQNQYLHQTVLSYLKLR